MNPTPNTDTQHVFEVAYSERDDGLANFRVCAEGVPKDEAIATITQLVGSLSAGMGLTPTTPQPQPDQEAP